MKKFTFKGGIHPPEKKESTEHKKILHVKPTKIMTFPMSQHIGAVCHPLVKVGDRLLMGQVIGRSDAFVSSPVHSSVSGEVIEIKEVLIANGNKVESIIIENDFKDELDPSVKKKGTVDTLSKIEIIDIVKEAGIVGMGGATFPTHVKLSPPPDKKIEYVIINGAECEPYLTSDNRIMIEDPFGVVDGLRAIMKVFDLDEGYIGIEENKPHAIERLKEAAKSFKGIHICTLKTKYPQGSEKQLIEAITKRQVPRGGLPADSGVLVQNVDTCIAISRAIEGGIPLIRRIVTISGDCIKEPNNYFVKIGTPVSELIKLSGNMIKEPKKVIAGGPMMGLSLASLDIPVVKGTSAILLLSEEISKPQEELQCIRCAKCISACPINLTPLFISRYSQLYDFENAEKYGALDCINCGSCSYVCPSKRHLAQRINNAKQKIMADKRKKG